ncbi:MAG: hypothetical protein JNL13_01920 [Chitinophagaceae bacterium]|nr:hypothetical protein [Chitinophagaceae bacterium]
MKLFKSILFLSCTILAAPYTFAQVFKDGKLSLNEDGSRYLKLSVLNQTWVRYNQNNPGSTVNGENKEDVFDIGIRRTRLQFYGPVAKRTFLYVHVGINNFNALSDRKAAFFLHDAVSEYEIVKEHLSLGAGLAGWTGLSRFASSSVSSIMGLDLPLYQEATNDVSDQFLRKLSVYAKGKIGKLDYRLMLTDPMAIQKSAAYIANPASFTNLTTNAVFSTADPKLQTQGYFQYQFLDQESNLVPYTTGTYLGSKSVFNIGAGFIYQPQAMIRLADNNTDTVRSAMRLLSVDAYYDAPLNRQKGTAISAYAAFSDYDFGKNYIRNTAPLNPATGNSDASILNGSGNGVPLYGTGQHVYAQLGYKMKNELLGKAGTLMPYASVQYSMMQKLADPMVYYDMGVNLLLSGHTSKLTLAYQNRPVYKGAPAGPFHVAERKSAVTLQWQVSL